MTGRGRDILPRRRVPPAEIGIVIHGTTLATNAIIERKGARTALITTQGFRDVIAMGNESRYDQYDLNIVLPEPLVPRHSRSADAHWFGTRHPAPPAHWWRQTMLRRFDRLSARRCRSSPPG